MIFQKSVHRKGRYLNGLLLSAYIFFLLVNTFHYHTLHITGQPENPEYTASGSSINFHSAENLTDGCYLANYVNSIFNIDSLDKNEFHFHNVPSLVHAGKTVLNQPQGFISIPQFRGPPSVS